MYRALTYGILKNKIDFKNPSALEEYLKRFELDIHIFRRERHYFVENEDVTQKIRKDEVTAAVSEISALKSVREKLMAVQRALAEGVNAVFEGRDMGTVVFPDASLKVFLTGRDEVRAKRRFDELKTKFPDEFKDLTIEKCLEEITKRDYYDSHRDLAPLIQAKDAFVVDTSDMNIDEIVFKILEHKDSLKTRKPS